MTWKDLPLKLKTLIAIITAAALPIASWAIWDLLHHQPLRGSNWIILVVLTLITVPFFHFLPSVSTIIGIGDTYIMAVAMMYGTAPCIVATLCHTLFASIIVPKPRASSYKVVFNTSSMICGALLYSEIYRALNPDLSGDPRWMLLPAAVLMITFFLFNSLVTSVAISWATRASISQFWIKNCLPLSIQFSLSTVFAVIIVAFSYFNDYVPFGVAPLVGLVWGWAKINKSKTLEAEKHLKEQEQLYLRTVETLALAVDAKDQTTYGHIRRVRAYALGLAKLAGVTDANELKAIETGSLLHDIGKLAIEDYILNKPGRLSKREFEKMKMHATAGDEILQEVQFPFPVARYVRYHHERWDGTGYPDGLKGDEIPLGSRILAIADAFDAIRSTRPYKSAFGIHDSVELLRTQAGSNYDPRLVELFVGHIEELETAADEAAKNISELSFRKYFESIESTVARTNAFPLDQTQSTTALEELVRLLEFCGGVGRSLVLADALPIVARHLKQIVPYDACAFFMYRENDSVRAEYACGGFAAPLQGMSIGLGKGISGWVAAYKRPMVNTSPALEFQGTTRDFTPLKDALVVPLVQEGECLGTISLYACEALVYSQTHLSLLQTVAEQVAPLVRDACVADKPEGESLVDPVTATYRVAYLSVAGTPLLAHAAKTQTPLSLVHIEIRNFSHNVSLYGPGMGDSILRKVADTLRSELRQTDILVRFGHDGFVALLPGVRSLQAARYVHRVQQQIKSAPMNVTPGNALFVNCQAGIASYPDDGSTLPALLQTAQRVLIENARLASPQVSGSEGNVLEFPPRV